MPDFDMHLLEPATSLFRLDQGFSCLSKSGFQGPLDLGKTAR